ncbi:zinc finger, CCHC-type containing protein [Tanacetum coccineum]|uniref:Zinc finger, CCHC-type containing protein n=1 Tax=Tanacetum coccineum TaxID=301880 RepID=A0ABQ5G2E9_9ASTR
MLGSIDCMHWEWVKCPKSLHGQFKRRDKKYPTIMLEAVADQQLWFWHAYFGVPGANNDLNVLYGSPLFDDLLADKAPEAPFQVNGKTYEKGYYLADGIYPQWATFVKAFTIARDLKTQKFKRVQESARKDIERAFGVLQAAAEHDRYYNSHDQIRCDKVKQVMVKLGIGIRQEIWFDVGNNLGEEVSGFVFKFLSIAFMITGVMAV